MGSTRGTVSLLVGPDFPVTLLELGDLRAVLVGQLLLSELTTDPILLGSCEIRLCGKGSSCQRQLNRVTTNWSCHTLSALDRLHHTRQAGP